MANWKPSAAALKALCVLSLLSSLGLARGAFAQPSTNHYHIGAWYFTAWSSANRGSLEHETARLYGRNDTWGGVRDYAEGRGRFPVLQSKDGAPVDYSDRKPLLGYYDEMDQSIIDRHIEQAASEGIDFFAFYWYLDMNTGEERSPAVPIVKFFSSRFRDQIKLLIAPVAHGGQTTKRAMSLTTWQNVVVPRIISYMTSPSYFRLRGRPVLIDFQLPFDTQQARALAYRALRDAAKSRIGVDVMILYLLGGSNTWQDLEYQLINSRPDGFTCFNFGTARPAQSYSELISEWLPHTLKQVAGPRGNIDPSLIYLPCGSTGMDARPWFGVGWKNGSDPNSRPYVADPSPETFREHLLDVKRFIDSQRLSTLNTAIVYSWNEWGEGAACIEPSKHLGYAYADIVRQVFALVPRGSKP